MVPCFRGANSLKRIKELTKSSSLVEAIRLVWQAGIETYEHGHQLTELENKQKKLAKESLELSRLVHDYETRIHNIIRENTELKRQNKELTWGYRALLRENQWLKEEVFKLKGKEMP